MYYDDRMNPTLEARWVQGPREQYVVEQIASNQAKQILGDWLVDHMRGQPNPRLERWIYVLREEWSWEPGLTNSAGNKLVWRAWVNVDSVNVRHGVSENGEHD